MVVILVMMLLILKQVKFLLKEIHSLMKKKHNLLLMLAFKKLKFVLFLLVKQKMAFAYIATGVI